MRAGLHAIMNALVGNLAGENVTALFSSMSSSESGNCEPGTGVRWFAVDAASPGVKDHSHPDWFRSDSSQDHAASVCQLAP